MKRFFIVCLFVFFGLQTVAWDVSASPLAQHRKPPRRAVVVVHKNWPLRRPLRQVVMRPARFQVRVASARFLPVVFWGGIIAVSRAPLHDRLVWEDGETLSQDEDWTEFTLNCNNTGSKLWVEVAAGRVQFDWAEVVFGNGETQVVDMKEGERGPGLYELMNIQAGRKVDHVRVVARAMSPEAKAALKMEK